MRRRLLSEGAKELSYEIRESIDFDHAFYMNRWEKGETADFINCPLDKETYTEFVRKLCEAEAVEPRPFEKNELFEGCLPVEEMARRGYETLRHGPMRPIGLGLGNNGHLWYAVIQLRAENKQKTLFNMVGFQTRLKWGTQKEIFTMVPALRNAKFARLGCMHRNTFIESPKFLDATLQGACAGCGSAMGGTLFYIEDELKNNVYYNLIVEPEDPLDNLPPNEMSDADRNLAGLDDNNPPPSLF